jgi:LPS sulfotransferase NodH
MTKTFVLILSSQRSGSTLFCQDLESIGVGVPREHALPFIRSSETFSLEQLYSKCKSNKPNQEIFALKSMMDYTPKLVAVRYPNLKNLKPMRTIDEHVSVIELFIEILKSDFNSVVPFILTRNNTVDVAISRALAQLTNVYHSEKVMEDPHTNLDLELVIDKIFDNLPRARRENKVLHALADRLGHTALTFDYHDLTEKEDEVFISVKAHLLKYGVQSGFESFTRNRNKKIVANETSNYLKRKLNAEFGSFVSLCNE